VSDTAESTATAPTTAAKPDRASNTREHARVVARPPADRPPYAFLNASRTDSTDVSPGLGYQLTSVIAGGPAPLIAAKILQSTGSSTGISWYIVGCCVLGMGALPLMPRRSDPADAQSLSASRRESTSSASSPSEPAA